MQSQLKTQHGEDNIPVNLASALNHLPALPSLLPLQLQPDTDQKLVNNAAIETPLTSDRKYKSKVQSLKTQNQALVYISSSRQLKRKQQRKQSSLSEP